MKVPSKTAQAILFLIWIAPLTTAALARPEYVTAAYAADWAITQGLLGSALWVTASISATTLAVLKGTTASTSGA